MSDRAVRISKFLSLVLRHQPEKIGLKLNQSGWASVERLIEASRRRGIEFTLEELHNVVAGNDKRRFSLSEDGLWIRANQGHSINIELGYAPTVPPEILYHGTAERFLVSIKQQGLIKGKRHSRRRKLTISTANHNLGGIWAMSQTYISEISKHLGEEITIKGWLYNKRSSGKLGFLEIRDGSGTIQGVVSKKDVSDEVWENTEKVTQESSVVVGGAAREHPKKPGVYELDIKDLRIVQLASEYPITPKEHGVEFLMDHRHLWLRSRRQHAILRVRHEIIRAVRDFFDNSGFILCDTPVFTPAACEGTTTLFEVSYFDEKAYLTQSGQLYNEATAAAFGKVYCFGPTFRAEKSKTRRHLTEFWMVEPEVAFARLDDIMVLAEDFISFIVGRVLENRKEELKQLERDISKLEKIAPPFPRLQYDDAVMTLQDGHAKGEMETRFEWGGDLGSPDETYLSNKFDKPVMIHRYPAAVKAFYMEPDPERPELALCVDVLAPEGYGEIIGGGERASSLELLLNRIQEHGLPEEAFDWYLGLRKYGSVPHAGFGMGIERCVAWLCGLEHVRETIPFPRMLYRLKP